MTVYVDNARIKARVGRITGCWSHLTADTKDELHAFADALGLHREWFQEQCKTRCAREGQPCPHWHYDVTDGLRDMAIMNGATSITWKELGPIISARRSELRRAV